MVLPHLSIDSSQLYLSVMNIKDFSVIFEKQSLMLWKLHFFYETWNSGAITTISCILSFFCYYLTGFLTSFLWLLKVCRSLMVIKANGLTIKGFLSFQLSFTVYICILFLVFTCWVCSQVPVYDLYPVSCWCTCRQGQGGNQIEDSLKFKMGFSQGQ